MVSETINVSGAGYKVIMLLEGKADIYLYPRFFSRFLFDMHTIIEFIDS
jgi:3'-phosphoadenosine 5'-phosphosulfate (PAPS) 3'-phosphatase